MLSPLSALKGSHTQCEAGDRAVGHKGVAFHYARGDPKPEC
jgi:hypothetical protein